MNTNTVVTNHTNFDSRKVKSLRVTTTKYYDEDGRIVSEEKVEEFEYEPSGIQYPAQPYVDPYQLLRDKVWPNNPVVWSSDKGSYIS